MYYGYGAQGYGGRGELDFELKVLINRSFLKDVLVVDGVEVVIDNEEELIKRINHRITMKKERSEVKFRYFSLFFYEII
jgi:hypothetical protein